MLKLIGNAMFVFSDSSLQDMYSSVKR